jgi:hypothetical protein
MNIREVAQRKCAGTKALKYHTIFKRFSDAAGVNENTEQFQNVAMARPTG